MQAATKIVFTMDPMFITAPATSDTLHLETNVSQSIIVLLTMEIAASCVYTTDLVYRTVTVHLGTGLMDLPAASLTIAPQTMVRAIRTAFLQDLVPIIAPATQDTFCKGLCVHQLTIVFK